MYSMKRSVWPVPRKCSASATMPASLTPRLTTAFTFTGRPAAAAASMPSSTRCDGEVDVVQRAEDRVVDGVEAHGDAVEAGVRERLRLLRQERAVRRQRELEVRDLGELRDEPLDVAADERLAAGEADRADAEAGEDADDAGDLLEAEELLPVEERVVAAEGLLRHAVDAAEVAAVGDGDAQRLERPAERVAATAPWPTG